MMAGFETELPTDLINSYKELTDNVDKMMGEMTTAGAKLVYEKVKQNMKSSFKSTDSLEKGLKITRVYKTPTDDGINNKVAFYGYDSDGVAIPLKAMAREYGTSHGEKKKPFFRKAFRNKEEIENAMKKVQDRYIKDE